VNIGFDFDGVLCPTPFGRLAVHAPSPVDDLPSNYEDLYRRDEGVTPIRLALEYLRFAWRGAAADASTLLRDLSRQHRLYIVTGRSRKGERLMHRWLARRGWRDYFTGVWMSPDGLRTPQHKLAVAKMIAIDAHIDDDPRTAYHLAKHGVRAFLLDHAGAHGDDPLPNGLTLVRSLEDFAEKIDDAPA
jgi:hypothetical protein